MAEPAAAADAADPPLPACLVVDHLWEAFTESGAAAFAGDRSEEAAELWRVAERLSHAFAAADPRRAASLANLAAALDRAGAAEPSDLEALYRRALAAWAMAPQWIARMAPDHKPRSSLFHQRMERKHRAAYVEIARQGYRQLAEGGRAACLGNLAGWLARRGRTAESEPLYRAAIAGRELALGARDAALLPLAAALAELLADAGQSSEAEALRAKGASVAANHALEPGRRWTSEKPVRMSDTRRLFAAVYLTPVIRR